MAVVFWFNASKYLRFPFSIQRRWHCILVIALVAITENYFIQWSKCNCVFVFVVNTFRTFVFLGWKTLFDSLGWRFLLLYQLLFNYKLGYHTHHLYGLHFALLPFYFKKENFYLSASFARIMVCITYFFAGFFKLIGKGYLSLDSFSNTLQNQHSAYFYFHSDSIRSQFAMWMINHENMAWMFFFMAMLMQLSFVGGLLSKRFDPFLFAFLVLFHLMDWFLMNLGIFMGMCIMSYLFLLPKSLFKDLRV